MIMILVSCEDDGYDAAMNGVRVWMILWLTSEWGLYL